MKIKVNYQHDRTNMVDILTRCGFKVWITEDKLFPSGTDYYVHFEDPGLVSIERMAKDIYPKECFDRSLAADVKWSASSNFDTEMHDLLVKVNEALDSIESEEWHNGTVGDLLHCFNVYVTLRGLIHDAIGPKIIKPIGGE